MIWTLLIFCQFTGIQKDQNHGPPQSNPNHQRTMSAPMPIGGQFNQPRHQQDMMPNQMLMQQQQNLMVQGILALCEFHYCNFSKNSINLPYANFGLFYFISAIFWTKQK